MKYQVHFYRIAHNCDGREKITIFLLLLASEKHGICINSKLLASEPANDISDCLEKCQLNNACKYGTLKPKVKPCPIKCLPLHSMLFWVKIGFLVFLKNIMLKQLRILPSDF